VPCAVSTAGKNKNKSFFKTSKFGIFSFVTNATINKAHALLSLRAFDNIKNEIGDALLR